MQCNRGPGVNRRSGHRRAGRTNMCVGVGGGQPSACHGAGPQEDPALPIFWVWSPVSSPGRDARPVVWAAGDVLSMRRLSQSPDTPRTSSPQVRERQGDDCLESPMVGKRGAGGRREGSTPVARRGDQVRGAGEVQFKVKLLMGGAFVILWGRGGAG